MSNSAAPVSADINTSEFVHLRIHTEFSISDGLVTITPLIKRLQELAMPAVAVTDVANLFGLIKFYSSANAKGIKPICGVDIQVEDQETSAVTPLVLLVKNRLGYANLTRLISSLYTENSGLSRLVTSQDVLAQYSEGLIALSGAQNGDIGRRILEGDGVAAQELLQSWQRLFPGAFYLELQRTGRANEEEYITGAVKLAIENACPVVATNDVRFVESSEFEAHEVRVCINERRTLDDKRRTRQYSEQQYLKSADEMHELFSDIPEAIANSVEIAKRCSLSLELGTPYLPNYPVPDERKLEDYLCDVSRDGLVERLEYLYDKNAEDFPSLSKPYYERLDIELGIINQMGFAGYFLIVMEFIQWAKDNGIPVGPGRGSGAGSIVAYALKITDLDPLKYDLLFERFLNPERVSMPDFDVDFCMDGRDRVIQHVADLYGKDAVSQIITFGTMAAKAVVRDVARVQGKPHGLADKLSKLIPFEPGITLEKAFKDEPLLGAFVKENEDAQEIMEMAYKLEGITRNVGKHAGGVVIAPTVLTDFTPLYCDEGGQGLVTQFDKNDVETAGLVKFDFLGLRTLTIIDWALKMINARPGATEKLSVERLPLDDPLVYRLLQNAETTAVFQLESRGMKDLIKRLVPSCFEDIIALVALFRPGPLQSGMVDDFINRKHGREKVVYPHPELEPVLANTYGVILYQEQVMQIAQVLASYTLGGADNLRKAMGKKKPEVMAKQRDLFVDGATARGIDKNLSGSIFDLMEKFAGYGFNKSHSAAYALVSYQTAWLKAHYPSYFMAAVLSADMQNTDKVVTLIDECRSMKLAIVTPDVNRGSFNFTVSEVAGSGEGKAREEIVYGLGAIKGLGEGPVEAIIEAREQGGKFADLMDFCLRVDSHSVNKRTMEALIKSGALDSLVTDEIDLRRARLTAELPDAIKAAEQSSRNQDSGVDDLFGEIVPVAEENRSNGMGLPRPGIRPWSEQQRLSAEKETLGLYLSGHPIEEYLPELAHITPTRLANLRPERNLQLVSGLLHGVRTMKSKSGDTIAFMTLDDQSGRIDISLSGAEYERYRELLHKDSILVLQCVVSVDDYSGGMRGRGKKVMTLSEAREHYARRLAIQLNEAQLQNGFCEQLSEFLGKHRAAPALRIVAGQDMNNPSVNSADRSAISADNTEEGRVPGCPVIVNYHSRQATGCIMLGNEWRVKPTEELIQGLRQEYGKKSVKLEYTS